MGSLNQPYGDLGILCREEPLMPGFGIEVLDYHPEQTVHLSFSRLNPSLMFFRLFLSLQLPGIRVNHASVSNSTQPPKLFTSRALYYSNSGQLEPEPYTLNRTCRASRATKGWPLGVYWDYRGIVVPQNVRGCLLYD